MEGYSAVLFRNILVQRERVFRTQGSRMEAWGLVQKGEL